MSTDWTQSFSPGVAPASEASPPRPGVERIAYGGGPQQFGDLRLPAAPAGKVPVALVIHGGAYVNRYHLDLMDGLCDDLAARGIATWNIEYRRVGDPGADWPATFDDVAAAAQHLRRIGAAHHLDLLRVAALGHSAGGHLALWLAAPSPPAGAAAPLALRGVVALAPVVRLSASYPKRPDTYAVLMGGSPAEVPERYAAVSPRDNLPLSVPSWIVVGDQDDLAPSCRDYVAAAQAAGDPAQLVELSGVEHFQPIVRGSPAWERAAELVVRLLA